MRRIKPEVDIIFDILKAVLEAQPSSDFVKSLISQYQERGGLSKKQLQGLYSKATKVVSISPAKLATLEAIILKKAQKHRSEMPTITPVYEKDEKIGTMINAILAKFPQHKRVLFFKSRFENNEQLSSTEITELNKFHKLLLKN